MLLPSLQNARAVAKSAVCKNNQKNMYTGYMMHIDDGLEELLKTPWKVNNKNQLHKPGQLMHRNNLQIRIKQGVLGLQNTYDMNCPTFYDLFGNNGNGTTSSYGSNSEGNDTHYSNQSDRLYFPKSILHQTSF